MPSSITDTMLPPEPPKVSNKDFDPATVVHDDDLEMETEENEPRVELSSVEINILIYLYLLESNFSHTAFTLLSESNLPQTSLFQHFNPSFPTPSGSISRKPTTPGLNNGNKNSPSDATFGSAEGRIPRGELVRKLWKGLRWEEVERHVSSNGELVRPGCPNSFHLLIPHTCPPSLPSSNGNPALPLPPSLRVSPPPTRRPEAFPPGAEPEPVAGPSRNTDKSNTETASVSTTRGKRKSRRNSDASTSRNPSPARSFSPVKDRRRDKDRKRAKRGADTGDNEKGVKGRRGGKADGMDIDEEQPKRSRLREAIARNDNPEPSRLSAAAPNNRRSKSPLRPDDDETEEDEEPVERRSNQVEEGEEGEEGEEEADEDEEERKAKEEQDAKDEVRKQRATWISDEDINILSKEHSSAVSCVMWNPKNRDVLATTSHDGTARLWELVSKGNDGVLEVKGEPKMIKHASIESNKKAVWSLDWHPEGTVFATGSQDGTGRIFTPSGSLQGIMPYGRGSIRAVKFSPSGSQVLIAKTDNTVALWTVTNHYNQNMTRSFSSHTQQVNDVDWLDENIFASCGNDRKIFVYRSNDRIPRYTFGDGHTDDITKIAWQPVTAKKLAEQRLLASASDDGTIRLWSLNKYPKDKGSNYGSTSNGGNGSPAKRDPDSSEDDDEGDDEPDFLKKGDTSETGKKRGDRCVRVLEVVGEESENKRLDTVVWNRDGSIIAAGGQDTTIKLFDVTTGNCIHVLKGLEEGTGSIAFSSVGRGLVAGGGWNGRLLIWSTDSGEVVGEWEFDEDPHKQRSRDQPMMLSMSWRDDAKQLAVGMHNKQVLLVHTAKLVEEKDGAKAEPV